MTARLLVGLVRVYQWVLSPMLGDRCKYHPTCSQYAIDALHEHGAARGTVLAAWRVLRCNPWSAGGVDHAREQTLFRRSPRGRHA